MYVLCIDFKLDFSVIDVGLNLFEGFYYQVSVRFRNNALSAEHFGVSHTALDVLCVHSLVESD